MAIPEAEMQSRFHLAMRRALEKWAPESQVFPLRPMGGFSGAVVYVVDISPRSGSKESGDSLTGNFIVKVYEHGPWNAGPDTEQDRHRVAYELDSSFSRAHLPRLLYSLRYPEEDEFHGLSVLLYELAGPSLSQTLTLSEADIGILKRMCSRLSFDLLRSWAEKDVQPPASSYHLLDQWLEYRLRQEKAPDLHTFIEREMGGQRETTIAGTAVVNPLALCRLEQSIAQSDEDDVAANTWVRGLMHGDLHSGNILLSGRLSPTNDYWLIDLALSRTAPVGYDHGYLEMALIHFLLQNGNEEQLLGVLRSLDDSESENRALPMHQGLVDCLRAVRASVERWRERTHNGRLDAINRQFLLGRVAAGINWANKPLEVHEKRIALAYAAWAARLYVHRFRGDRFRGGHWQTELPALRPERAEEEGSQKSSLWIELWTELGKFDDPLARYVLIADPLGNEADLSCLGLLPWSLIVDFDFQSEDVGLYHHAAPVLETSRALHAFSLDPVLPDFERGTAWMMARGWTRDSQSIPDHHTWRIKHRSVLRKVFQQFFRAIDPNRIRIVFLTNRTHTSDPDYDERLFLTIDVIAETCTRTRVFASESSREAEAKIYQIGGESRSYTQRVRHVPLTARDVIEQIRDTYGTSSHHKIPSMPAVGGVLKPIPIDTMRLLEEGFDLLHSNILHDADSAHRGEFSSFRRGSPPDWHDLNAANDVPRRVQEELTERLEKRLKENRNYTVQMSHMPGAGGTTLALRVAWNLHQRYPTVILRYKTRAMAAHLERLFYTLQRPILLVADASVLTDSSREALYRELASKNCRVVTLYIRRSVRSDVGKPSTAYSIQLPDPLDPKESKDFFNVFSGLTGDANRQEEIQRITERPEFEQYRIPFFYGLVTFDKDFINVDRFVHIHLANARPVVRRIVEFLALITRFSKTGMHEVLLHRLLGATETFQMSLRELMGEGPCRMLVQDGYRLKLMHPRIAEEVLRTMRIPAEEAKTGSSEDLWIEDLPDLAADFIRDIVRVGGHESDEVLGLLGQLFIHREIQVLEESENRNLFSEIIEIIDEKNPLLGHQVLKELRDNCRNEAHFWNHLGRHLIYRVGRDYEEAEKCLEQATILSPNDHVHHHTLGMVRRFWIESMIRGLNDPSPEDILYKIDDKYGDAIEAFANGRKLNRQDDYSYITQIQLILRVANEMKRASGAEHLGALQESSHAVAAWIEENIPEAERLLEAAKRTYGHLELRDADYVTRCTADLKQLYGELDQVITVWELSLRKSTSSPQARRSLALAYLARRGRNWTLVSEGECERIVFLMEDNLRRGNPRPTDYWLWFQAYRQTRRFSYDDALRRLHLWKQRSEVGQPHYYIYILNFLLWFHRDDELSTEFREAREQSSKLAIGRRTRSFEWLGKNVAKCPLVFEDVLTWNDEERFWHDTASLRRVNGIILDMPGPQSGRIRIDGRVDVFFVPGKQFFRYSHENKKVNFFLGFSYDGPRAWQVGEGWVEEGRRHHTVSTPIDRKKLARSFLKANPAFEQFAPQAVAAAHKSMVIDRIRDFSLDYVQAGALQESHVELSDIAARIESIFNFSATKSGLGFENIEALLKSFPGVRVDVSDGRSLVTSKESRRHPNLRPRQSKDVRRMSFVTHFDRKAGYGFIFHFEDDNSDYHFTLKDVHNADIEKIRKGVWVDFQASRGKVLKAHKVGIRKANGHSQSRIEDPNLTGRVRRTISEIFFEDSETSSNAVGHASVALERVSAKLTEQLPGKRPAFQRLGYPGLPEMLLGLGFELSRNKPVRLLEASANQPGGLFSFGASREISEASADVSDYQAGQTHDRSNLALDKARQQIQGILTTELETRNEVPLSALGPRLRQEFKEHLPAGKNVHVLFGKTKLTHFLKTFPGFALTTRNDMVFLRKGRTKPPERAGGEMPQIRKTSAPDDMRQQVRKLVEREIDRAGGLASLARVGKLVRHELAPLLPPGESLYGFLRTESLGQLLRSFSDYEVSTGVGDGTLRRREGAGEAPSTESEIRQRARAIVEREVAAAGPDGALLTHLGSSLRKGLADLADGPLIFRRLKSKNLSSYLKTLEGLEIVGSYGHECARSTGPAEARHSESSSVRSLPSIGQEALHSLLRDSALGSIPQDVFGIHLSAMANALRKCFEQAGYDWGLASKALGLERGLDLSTILPELTVYKLGSISILIPKERLKSAQSLYEKIQALVGSQFSDTDNLPFAKVEQALADGLDEGLLPPSRTVNELYGFKAMDVFLKALDGYSHYPAKGGWMLLRGCIPQKTLELRREELNAASLVAQAGKAEDWQLEDAMTERFRTLIRNAVEDTIVDSTLQAQALGSDASLTTISQDLNRQFLDTANLLAFAGFTAIDEMCKELKSVILLGDELNSAVMPDPSQMKILALAQDLDFFHKRIERYLIGLAAANFLAQRSTPLAAVMVKMDQRFPDRGGFWNRVDLPLIQEIIEASALLFVGDEATLRLVPF